MGSMAGFNGRAGRWFAVHLGLGLLCLLGLAGCRPRPVPIVERLRWQCVPVEIASIDARAQEVEMFLPGDQAHSFRLVAPDVCRDLAAKASPLAEVEFWVTGTAKAGITGWHPETINGKRYEVLGGAEGSPSPTLQVDFRRVLRERR